MLHSTLERAAREWPDGAAVVSDHERCSFRELHRRSNRLANTLLELGIRPGDRVVVLGENGMGASVAWWAILKCHAICVFLSDSLKAGGLEYIVGDVTPSLYLCSSASGSALVPKDAPRIELDDIAWSDADTTECKAALPDDPSLIASIVYTSGSTGSPKGVCLTHANLLSSGEMAAVGHDLGPDDLYLMVVPLHYVHGQMMLVSLVMTGACLEFMPSFVFPVSVTERLRDRKVTCMSGVPYHFSSLIDRGKFLTTNLPFLRWICVTGGVLSPDRLSRITADKPDLDIHIAYGQTECSPRIARLAPAKVGTKPTSIGSAEPGLVVQLIDEAGEPVGKGETGELVVSGPGVMHGYWNDAEGTAKVIDEQGRLLTGDLAVMDADGDLFIRGRRQAMIKSAGERIFPEELEAVLIKHPNVADVAVVGEPDEMYGQAVVAHVVLVTSGTEREEEVLERVRLFCLEQVPFARAPRRYHPWTALPLTANGKTDKPRLTVTPDAR